MAKLGLAPIPILQQRPPALPEALLPFLNELAALLAAKWLANHKGGAHVH